MLPVGGPRPVAEAFEVRLGLSHADFEDRADVRHENTTLTLSVSAQVVESLALTAALPWRRLDSEGRVDEGLGDATLTALWSAWEVGLIAGLRFPTGENDLDAYRGARGKVVPLGNGTFDLLLGATYRMPPFFDTLVLSIPLNEAEEEPPPGVELGTVSSFSVFNRLGAGISIAWLALDLQWTDGDGTFAWATPGLTWGPLELSAQIPLHDGHPTVTVSLGFSW